MKKLFTCIFFIWGFGTTTLFSQEYHKTFVPLAEQPGIKDTIRSFGGSDNMIYLFSGPWTNDKRLGIVSYYDGMSWSRTDSFYYIGQSSNIMYHEGSFYISGKFREINNIEAPSGKYYSLAKLGSSGWDTVHTSLLDDTVKLSRSVFNNDGIYLINEQSKNLTNVLLFEPGKGFTTTYAVRTTLPAYKSLGVSAQADILFVYAEMGSSITSVNGTSYGDYFQVSKGVLSTPALNVAGSIIAASVSYKNEIFYISELGSMMIVYDGTTRKDIESNLGDLVNLGAQPFLTHDEVIMPGVVNGLTNSLVILDKDSTNWAEIALGPYGMGLVHSINAGTFLIDNRTITIRRMELGGRVSGKVYLDIDSSCTLTSGEYPVSGKVLRVKGNRDDQYVLTDENGLYKTSSGEDIISFSPADKYLSFSPCVILSDTITAGLVKVKDLPLHASDDLEGLISGQFRARWGDTISIKVTVHNQGMYKRNARVKLTLPAEVDYVSSTPSGSIGGRMLEWQIGALSPFQKKVFTVNVGVSLAKTKTGDDICYQLAVDTFDMENDTANNFDTLCQRVVSSYDPNSKESYPSGVINYSPEKINYVINFQNLGSDFARHVVIRDTLSGLLHPAALLLEESSHNCKVTLEGRVLILSFRNINLNYAAKDSSGSKGWAAFSIGAAPGLKPGTVISNRAYIYFDYNPAIITNDALLTVAKGTAAGISSQKTSLAQLYPNPASDLVTVSNLEGKNHLIAVYNMQGMLIKTFETSGKDAQEISVKEWASGIYFIKTDSGVFKMMKID
jgi:hypothetical protein